MISPFKTALHSAASATANGTVVNTAGYPTVGIQITGTFTATVTFEVSIDGATWVAVAAKNLATGASATTATVAGIFVANVAGYDLFRARMTWTSGTSITVVALVTTESGDSSGSGAVTTTSTISSPLGRGADAASVSVALSTEDVALLSPLQVVGSSLTVTPTHTVDTAIYAAGDTVGTITTITNAFRTSGKESILQSIHILDRSNQKPTGNLLFFNASPAAATTTDNAAFVYSTDDLKEVARVPIATGDYVTVDSKATANLVNLGRQVYATTGTSLFVVFVTDGSPDFVATTDFQISYSFLRD